MKQPVPQYDATDCLGCGHVYSLSFTAPPTICELVRCTETVRSVLLSAVEVRGKDSTGCLAWTCLCACSLLLSLSLSLSLSPFGESNIVSPLFHVTHLICSHFLHYQWQTHLSLSCHIPPYIFNLVC